MSLGSNDVREKQFSPARRARRGYDEGEVDDFLDAIVAALEERDATVADLGERLAAADRAGYPESPRLPSAGTGTAQPRAGGIVDLLALAQKTAEEYVAAAETEAAETLCTVRRDAEEVISAAHAEAARLLAKAERERAGVLETLLDEQRQITEQNQELLAAGERARVDMEAFLLDVLSRVQDRDLSRRPADVTLLSA